ncbi:squalene synthetase-like protein [Cytospora paraplurivora]|uniref:Protein SQS1 n=1 Tax=Cytospora paraplurivora TaxID=2898453 RepID=A0AAN9UDY7_9PEZI
MAKQKKGRAAKAARFRAMTASRPQNQHQDIAAQLMPRAAAAHSFSLRDEARNTAKHTTTWDPESKLRARPVVFVSAGLVEPLKELDEPRDHNEPLGLDGTADASKESDVSVRGQSPRPNGDGPAPISVAAAIRDGNGTSGPIPPDEELPFFIDTTGDQKLSSRSHNQPSIIPDPHPSGNETDSSEEVVLFKGRNRRDEDSPPVLDQMTIEVHAVEQTIQQISLDETDEANRPTPRPTSRSASPPAWQLRGHNDEDAIIADYMANMVADEDEDGSDDQESHAPYHAFFENRDLGGSDGDMVVVEESDSVDSEEAEEDESDDGSPELLKARDSGEDAEDGLDDETLARLLAKHEELGLADDEYMLFSTGGHSEIYPSRHNASTSLRKENISFLSNRTSRKQRRGKIPSASAVADVFDELDLMDWDRHNTHNQPRKPKNKSAQPIFDISDSELEATLQASWQKDRLSKRERKREREELRAQGLLGKHADPSDPRVKYQTGMTLDQIKEEMRSFLCGSDEYLTFPPMDANARKVIHDISNKFKIKSKSAGHGETRRPSLYRTKRTIPYNELSFEQVFARTGRKYFPRLDVKGKAPREGGKTGRSGRGVNHAAFSYRDGEVVGASAPELDQKNKGRTMLEKMGWTTGTALGAMDNKGILQPVVHVVKRSKAGLG